MILNLLEIDNLEMSLKIAISYRNPVDSKADFKLNIGARKMASTLISHPLDSIKYAPGHYNLTATLKMTEVDTIG